MKLPALATAFAIAGVTTFVFPHFAAAQTLPLNYTIQLQVRAATGGTAFNLPNGSSFNSVSPTINDAGNVAVKVNTVGTTTSPGIWFGGRGTGALVYNANDNAALISDPFINNNNQVSFPRFASTSASDDGLYVYNRATMATTRVTNGPLGATSYTNPHINDNGIIGMRVKFTTPQALMTYNIAANAFTNYVTENSGDPNSPYSFLYAPAFNNNNRLAAQANLTNQPTSFKQVRIWNADGSSTLVAQGDSSAGPVYYGFDNSMSMNNNDEVAFNTRTTAASSSRRIVVSNGTTTKLFPTVSDNAGFTSLDSFAPSVNDAGRVAFRGNDVNGRSSVFISDGTTVQRIAGVGDVLQTDIGPREVGSLMGNPRINNRGAVAFGLQFSAGSGGGNAIYVAYPQLAPTAAVSRKTHVSAGAFDVPLPLTGAAGVECRRGGGAASDAHQLVLTFPVAVTISGASVTSGTGSVSSASASGNTVTVNLAGVANAQTLTVNIANVSDGTTTNDVTIGAAFLLGDTNSDRVVNSGDSLQTRGRSGQVVDATNFRSDVNTDGSLNGGDTIVVRNASGASLP
jgi:hypothetical protein